jgi:hypothetical protein
LPGPWLTTGGAEPVALSACVSSVSDHNSWSNISLISRDWVKGDQGEILRRSPNESTEFLVLIERSDRAAIVGNEFSLVAARTTPQDQRIINHNRRSRHNIRCCHNHRIRSYSRHA